VKNTGEKQAVDNQKEKVVGIIGGMGPEATVDMMSRVIRATPAKDDIDHIRMLVDNNPKIPSRIKAVIEGTGESPAPCMCEMARNLVAWGADFLVIPCNTAHYYYDAVQAAVDVPVLNMIDLTVMAVITENPKVRRPGLLASTAVLMTGLYKKRFAAKGLDLIAPVDPVQAKVMTAIRQIKTGRFGSREIEAVNAAANELTAAGADVLIVACTELSIISSALKSDVRLYDTSQVLAEAVVGVSKKIAKKGMRVGYDQQK
jgi:aspartate racemase